VPHPDEETSDWRVMCRGVIGLATLDRDVGEFFQTRHVSLGGKTLEQFRVYVSFREGEKEAISSYLPNYTSRGQE
jgi:hypothetical protein